MSARYTEQDRKDLLGLRDALVGAQETMVLIEWDERGELPRQLPSRLSEHLAQVADATVKLDGRVSTRMRGPLLEIRQVAESAVPWRLEDITLIRSVGERYYETLMNDLEGRTFIDRFSMRRQQRKLGRQRAWLTRMTWRYLGVKSDGWNIDKNRRGLG